MGSPAKAAPGSRGLSDERLLARCAAGHTDAMSELVSRHGDKLRNALTHFLGNRSEAEDAVQETFLKLWKSAPRFNPRRRLPPWLWRIAMNEARTRLRKRRRRGSESGSSGPDGQLPNLLDLLVSGDPSPSDLAQRNETAQEVQHVLQGLGERHRQLLVMACCLGAQYRQMAQVLDIPIGSVKSGLHAAVGKFRLAWLARTPGRGLSPRIGRRNMPLR